MDFGKDLRLRSLVKTGVAGALYRTGADKLIGRLYGSRSMPLVLSYHRVVENFSASARTSIPAMLISRRMLEQHLDWIGRRFRFVSLDELGTCLESGKKLARPLAAVTFDDGYGDVYYHAFPLLKRKGIPAAFFVVTDLMGTSSMQIHDRLYLLMARAVSSRFARVRSLASSLLGHGIKMPEKARMNGYARDPVGATSMLLGVLPQAEIRRVMEQLEAEIKTEGDELEMFHPLSWEMIAEMRRAGMIIGSHTKSHAVLTNEELDKVQQETEASREELKRRLGIKVKHFAYPDGRFNASTVRAVATSGYRFGYTTCRHRDRDYPLLTIPRAVLWEQSCLDALGYFSPSIMSCHVNRIFQSGSNCRQDHDRLSSAVQYPAPNC